jgi:predicted MFS family arabinose efflux permease
MNPTGRAALVGAAAQPMRSVWIVTFCAACVLAITQGARGTSGLFISPMNTDTGIGIANIAFALAVGQFVWGAVQPVAGVLAGRWGYAPVLVCGIALMAAGSLLTPLVQGTLGLVVVLGIVQAAGAGVGSFSLLMAAAAQRIPVEQRAMSSGLINAGGSFGQFVFAPITAALIAWIGWVHTMWALAAFALLALPLVWGLRDTGHAAGPASLGGPGLRAQLAIALGDRSYLLLHAAFFTCGFHIAFLMTHLPTEIQLCGLSAQVSGYAIAIIGLFNIVGSLAIGWLAGFWRMRTLLFGLYGLRALAISAYLLAPKTPATLYVFTAVIGLTWLATVPPTAGLVAKLFGVRHLATLFGLTLLSHQIGGFLGAWLGGLAVEALGSYQMVWLADIVLAGMAAMLSLPVRETPPRLAAAAA